MGTLTSSRVGSRKAVAQNSEIYELQSSHGVKLIKWKNKREILMIYIESIYTTVLVGTRRTALFEERIMDSKAVID